VLPGRTKLGFFLSLLGITIVLAGLAGCASYAYQTKQQSDVLAQPAALARIVSSKRERSENTRFTDALLDYVRTSTDGPVDCKSSPVRFLGWSAAFDVGSTIEVHPQQGSCYRPIYAPDIGSPNGTLLPSLIALLIGTIVFALGYRLRSHQTTGST
jgi:hypothetical protein